MSRLSLPDLKPRKPREQQRARRNRQAWVYTVVILVLAAVMALQHFSRRHGDRAELPSGSFVATCSRVIDGDTIEVVYSRHKWVVRLAGIDAMDEKNKERLERQAQELETTSRHIARMARFARRQVVERVLHQKVEIVYPNTDPEEDKYGRLLGYVEVGDDDLGALLVKAGLAELYPKRHPRTPRYERLNREAREKKRGIYGVPKI